MKLWRAELNHMFITLILINQVIQTFASTADLEQSLKQRNYEQAIIKYDEIKSDKIAIEEVIKTIYKESNNIDILLYFTSLINNITERAALYESIYNLIIKDGGLAMYPEGTDQIRIRSLYSCNTMKYIEKFETTILKLLDNTSEQYKITLNNIENLKTDLGDKMKNELRNLNNEILNFTTLKYKSTNERLKCVLLLKDTNIIVKQYEMVLNNTGTDNVGCSLIVTDGTTDLDMVKKILKAQGLFENFKARFSYKYDYNFDETKEFENALIDKDYNLALIKLNSIHNNSMSSMALKKLYRKLYNLEDLIYFASLVANKNDGNLSMIKSIFEVIMDTDKFSICEAIKVIDILQYLRFKQPQHPDLIQFTDEIKANLTTAIMQLEKGLLDKTLKSPNENIDTYLIKVNKSYAIDIYDKNEEIHLGRGEFLIKKFDNESLCYYRGSVSITNYDYWYMKNYLILVNWFTFVVLVTKFC